jgi:hypothetical protein
MTCHFNLVPIVSGGGVCVHATWPKIASGWLPLA